MLKQRNAAPEPTAFVVHTACIRLRFHDCILTFVTPALYNLSCTPFLPFIQLPAYVRSLLGASDTSKVSSPAVSRLVGSRIVIPKSVLVHLYFLMSLDFCADAFSSIVGAVRHLTSVRAASFGSAPGVVCVTDSVTTVCAEYGERCHLVYKQVHLSCSFSSTEVPSSKKKPFATWCSSITRKLF